MFHFVRLLLRTVEKPGNAFGLSLALVMATCSGLQAATYYVNITGNDSNPGTQASPWRTIQKAANVMVSGDVVLIGPGSYGESIVTMQHGTSIAPITFRANPANGGASQVIARQFRVKHRFIVIEGFNLTGASDLNNAAIRIDFDGTYSDGSGCLITNNTIRDGVFLITTNASFGSNFVQITDGDFNAAGFLAGSRVFFGADSMYAYTNHDTAHVVASVSPDGKQLYVTDTLAADGGKGYWAAIYAGSANTAFKGVYIVPGPGISAASNCVIVNNTFTNLFGPNLIVNGENHLVKGNRFLAMHGWYAIQPQGRNLVIRDNLLLNSPNIIWFTPDEMRSIQHPLGSDYFDYQMNIVGSWLENSTNILFERNWIQNCDNQLTMIENRTNSSGFILRSNVFVGVHSHGSFSRSGVVFDHNTFYRSANYLGEAYALGIGGVSGSVQTGLVISNNAFVDIGAHENLSSEGAYAITDSTGFLVGNNFAAGPESCGWNVISPVPPGIVRNGGDPLFVNPRVPLGPDGLPFTDDDGLRPLPNSPLARLNIGALPALPGASGVPTAHFVVSSPQGWFDRTGTNFDLAWAALRPHQRRGVIRHWATAESLGIAPVTASFNAAGSVDGLNATTPSNAGIVAYRWYFGDGTTSFSTSSQISHSFAADGEYMVTLLVTNTGGQFSAYSNSYRVAANPLTSPTWQILGSGSGSNPRDLGVSPVLATLTGTNASATVLADARSFFWSFGDGGAAVVGSLPSASHLFSAAGDYWVTLWVTNSLGRGAVASNYFHVSAPAVTSTSWRLVAVGVDPVSKNLGAVPARGSFYVTNNVANARALVASCDWDFGDSATSTTTLPWVTHTYLSTGSVTVSAQVRLITGETVICSDTYQLSGKGIPGSIWHVATSGSDTTGDGSQNVPFATISKALSLVKGGDYVAVHAGNYGGIADLNRNVATSGNRVTLVGYGATLQGFNIRYPWFTIDGFTLVGPAISYGAPIYLYAEAHGTWVVNSLIGPFTNKTYGVFMARGPSGDPAVSAGSCIISNNVFRAIDWIQISMYGRSNLVSGNVFRDGNDQADTFRTWGQGHIICDNLMTNASYLRENHTDFFQIFGPDSTALGRAVTTNDYNWSKDILFERNVAVNCKAQICQIETFENPSGWFTNIVFRNNLFINVSYAANVDGDGTKWYNNLFYKVNNGNGGHVFAFGGPKGSAYGTEIKNCAFVSCGNGKDYGWYPIIGDSGVTNWAVAADYNFVSRPDNSAFLLAPPDASNRFRSQGQDVHGLDGGDPGFVSPEPLDWGWSQPVRVIY